MQENVFKMLEEAGVKVRPSFFVAGPLLLPFFASCAAAPLILPPTPTPTLPSPGVPWQLARVPPHDSAP